MTQTKFSQDTDSQIKADCKDGIYTDRNQKAAEKT